jgi:hypothetical protein
LGKSQLIHPDHNVNIFITFRPLRIGFSEVFEKTDVEAALAAGIFHREEVPIEAVKAHMRERGIETR